MDTFPSRAVARAIAAALLWFAAAFSANAANVTFYVPVFIDHVAPEFTEFSVDCQFYEYRAGYPGTYTNIGRHYSSTLPITGGAVRGRVVLFVNPEASTVLDGNSTYRCAMYFTGMIRFTHYVSWRGAGWSTIVSTDTRPLPFGLPFYSSYDIESFEHQPYAGYLPVAAGSVPVLATEMQHFTIDQMAELNLHGKCECGCGGDFDSGTAACDPNAAGRGTITFPIVPFESSNSGATFASPPRAGASLRPVPHGLPTVRGKITITTPSLSFNGIGTAIQCRGVDIVGGGSDCPALPPHFHTLY